MPVFRLFILGMLLLAAGCVGDSPSNCSPCPSAPSAPVWDLYTDVRNTTAILQEASGRIWFAERMRGLVSFNPDSSWSRIGVGQGWPLNARCSGSLSLGTELWVATDSGLLRQMDNAFVRVNPFAGPPISNVISACSKSPDGEVMASNVLGQLAVLEGGSWKILAIPFKSLNPTGWKVSCLAADGDGGIWVGTEYEGIYRYHNTQWLQIPVDAPVAAIDFDSFGNTWIATIGIGLQQFSITGTRFFDETTGMLSGDILSLFVQRNDIILAGSAAGLNILSGAGSPNNPQVPALGYIRPNEGLLDPEILSVFRDQSGSLWFGGPSGLSRRSN